MVMKQDDDRIKDLYRQSANEQSPAHLDEAILAASRKAVSARPRPAAPFSGRWQLPVSLAAVLIVTVLLVPLLQEEPHEKEKHDAATPVPSTVMPYDTDVSAPPAAMRQEVAAPKKQKARARPETQPVREEAEQKQGVLLREVAGDAAMTGEPDQQLKSIEALVDAGDETAAFAELQEFKRRYPDYPLPPGLEALWKKDR